MKVHTEHELGLIRGAAAFCGYIYRDHVVRDAAAIHILDGGKYRYYNPLDTSSPDFLDFMSFAQGLVLEVEAVSLRATYKGRYRMCPISGLAEGLGGVVVNLVLKNMLK